MRHAAVEAPERFLFFRHGILLNRWFLEPMARYFRRLGYTTRNRSYPSTKRTIEEHARDLADEVNDAVGGRPPGTAEAYFITHSLGGLILRYALTHHRVAGLRRGVLLVPPNQGAAKARYFHGDPGFRLLYGDRAGRQLCEEPPGIFAECGIPTGIELGIIAGVQTPPQIFPCPLRRPNDGVVSLEETRLGGFPVCELPVTHTTLLWRPLVWRHVAHFLAHGSFAAHPEHRPPEAPRAAARS